MRLRRLSLPPRFPLTVQLGPAIASRLVRSGEPIRCGMLPLILCLHSMRGVLYARRLEGKEAGEWTAKTDTGGEKACRFAMC